MQKRPTPEIQQIPIGVIKLLRPQPAQRPVRSVSGLRVTDPTMQSTAGWALNWGYSAYWPGLQIGVNH